MFLQKIAQKKAQIFYGSYMDHGPSFDAFRWFQRQDLLYSPTHCTEVQGGDDEDVLELKLTNAAFGIFGFISSLNGLGHDSMGLLVLVLSLIS